MDQRALPTAFLTLLQSDRVSQRTRTILLDRLPAPLEPAAIAAALGTSLSTLSALVDRIVPQSDAPRIDLVSMMVDGWLHRPGDGWRFADLPADVPAWRAGLASLDALAHRHHDADFASLDAGRQDRLLERIASNDLGSDDASSDGLLSNRQMTRWFEDMRAAAVRAYLSHPLTLARIRYDGFANGGDREHLQGFDRLNPGDSVGWDGTASSA